MPPCPQKSQMTARTPLVARFIAAMVIVLGAGWPGFIFMWCVSINSGESTNAGQKHEADDGNEDHYDKEQDPQDRTHPGG